MYFVEFRPKPNMPGEARIKLALLKGRTVYWVTGGYFEREKYEKAPLATEMVPDEYFSGALKQVADETKKERRARETGRSNARFEPAHKI